MTKPKAPLTVDNTEKDALIRTLLSACLESHDLLMSGWIEPRAINLTLQELEPAIQAAKQSGFVKSANWPTKYRYAAK